MSKSKSSRNNKYIVGILMLIAAGFIMYKAFSMMP